MDKDGLSNYHPISHISFLSKITESVVRLRRINHFSANNSPIRHHSTTNTLSTVLSIILHLEQSAV